MNKPAKLVKLQNQMSHNAYFDQVYREHFGRLYFFATTLTKSEELAKDVVSDVFVNLWNSNANFDKIRDIESYLFISVKNQAIQVISKDPNRIGNHDAESVIEEIDKVNPYDILIEKELLVNLEKAISALPDICQLVFRLAREQNMTYPQIAEELSIAPSTVKSHMIKAITDIRVFISERYDDQEKKKYVGGLINGLLIMAGLGGLI